MFPGRAKAAPIRLWICRRGRMDGDVTLVKKLLSKPAAKAGEEANYDPRMISAKKTPEKCRYPLHYLVWHNKHRQLERELASDEQVRGEQ